MVTLSKIIEGLEMVDDIVNCYYNLHKDEIFLSNIGDKGAFRRFKDYCIEMDIIQEWYNFRDKRYKEIAISWCKQNELEYM